MVDVDEQNQVNLALGQVGGNLGAEDRFNVMEARLLGPLLEQGKHFGLDVDRQHAAVFAHKLRASCRV